MNVGIVLKSLKSWLASSDYRLPGEAEMSSERRKRQSQHPRTAGVCVAALLLEQDLLLSSIRFV